MPMSAKDFQDEEYDPNDEEELRLMKLKVTGSFIFEDVESGEFTLNIFRSKDFQSREYHPQSALHQSYVVNYPILAYKSVAPDNSEIVLVHLAHDMP